MTDIFIDREDLEGFDDDSLDQLLVCGENHQRDGDTRFVPYSDVVSIETHARHLSERLETEREVLRDVKREGNRRIGALLRGMDSVAEYLETVASELNDGHARAAAESLRRWMKP